MDEHRRKEIEEVAKKYDIDINLLNDIIGEYEGRYGNYNIIEWYEGLKSTKFFLEDFKLERDDYSV